MFTGIIEDLGTVESIASGAGGGKVLRIRTGLDPASLAIGDSIAVNGTCLTVTAKVGSTFTVDAGPETLARTTTGKLTTGSRVNLERALTLSSRLGGHLVQGHVDGVATLSSVTPHANAHDLVIEAPAELMPLIAPQGSIAVDGISLTVTGVRDRTFSVMIIPHTLRVTSLGERRPGDALNLEVDLLARYVARLLEARGGGAGGSRLTEAFLKEHGF